LVAIRRPRVARVAIITVNAVSKAQAKTKTDPGYTVTGEAVTVKAGPKATAGKATSGKAVTNKATSGKATSGKAVTSKATSGKAVTSKAMACETAREAAATEATVETAESPVTATKATVETAESSVTTTKATVETAESSVTTTSATSERQSICRNCGSAEKTGCSERDSNLVQHDATPCRPTRRSKCIVRYGPHLKHIADVTIRNTLKYPILTFIRLNFL
jgi:hypothetical protein